ncbi:hypothetical protein FPV67DRAFT_1650841, partial [Lyophyllum atratum]
MSHNGCFSAQNDPYGLYTYWRTSGTTGGHATRLLYSDGSTAKRSRSASAALSFRGASHAFTSAGGNFDVLEENASNPLRHLPDFQRSLSAIVPELKPEPPFSLQLCSKFRSTGSDVEVLPSTRRSKTMYGRVSAHGGVSVWDGHGHGRLYMISCRRKSRGATMGLLFVQIMIHRKNRVDGRERRETTRSTWLLHLPRRAWSLHKRVYRRRGGKLGYVMHPLFVPPSRSLVHFIHPPRYLVASNFYMSYKSICIRPLRPRIGSVLYDASMFWYSYTTISLARTATRHRTGHTTVRRPSQTRLRQCTCQSQRTFPVNTPWKSREYPHDKPR